MFASKDTLLTRPSGGYTIARSVRLRSSASAYFNRTPASASNRTTWTLSFWSKRGILGGDRIVFNAGTTGSSDIDIFFPSDQFMISDRSGWQAKTTAVYRDPSAWYHFVVVLDTTQATSTNRIKIYVNGVQVTDFSSPSYPAQNATSSINNNVAHRIGTRSLIDNLYDGYLTEFNFIDGQALTPSSFGTTNAITGVWQPAKYTGTYGTNGFYLNFSDNSSNTATTIGKDYSGNANNWTPNNISVTAGATYDSMVDSPTVGATSSNYCVLNPVNATSASGTSLSNGNLQINGIGSGNVNEWLGTMGVSSGKWYYEVTMGENNGVVGISQTGNPNTYPGGDATSYGYSTSTKYNNNTSSSYGASLAAGDVAGVAYDLDAGTITFYKNGTSQGQAFSGLSGTYFPAIRAGSTGAAVSVNFGQRPFSYTPPTGYVALNTYNLPASTITNGAKYMAATTFDGVTGGGSVVNTVNGIGFQPDMVWMKVRNNANNHELADSVRGTAYGLFPNLTNAEVSDTRVSAFNSNGFSYGTNSNSAITGRTVVGWQWKAGTTSASNTNGSITSTVSVGATQGFSVVTYTGTGANATVGHGIGVAPSFVIVKERGNVNGWLCYHISTGNTGYLELDATLSFQTLSTVWNNTTPTSSVVSLGTVANVNRSGGTFVAYCFSAVAGYSAFGSYTANGSADGPFIYLGFRPRFIMFKRTTSATNWYIVDTAIEAYNAGTTGLYPNTSAAESTEGALDILSNGFKCRAASGAFNYPSTETFIYAAFAENPMKYALAR